jgi:bifunctional UDP-N-acetylglucosamine pyrophosphorylase/glucosamine-1-phosphate N-acetyltransferase
MEIYGIVGENTDIGAATVCGSLRFDDGSTVHNIKGRRETPENFSCAVYIGDNCRTGVNTTFFPGVKTGAYSVIGPASIIAEDVPEGTLVYPKQELVKKNWGFEKYGW